MRHASPALALLVLVGLSACAQDPANSHDSLGTGALLSVDYFGDTDVVGFHFAIDRVSCTTTDSITPFSTEANVDLVDGIFPGGISLVEQTLDPESRHLGSDFFISLEPGCYEVTATPAQSIDGDDWVASADCASATEESAEVTDGATTEVTLISQCVGDESGALDTLVLLNHPPVISVAIDEKFNYECEAVNVCATAYDVDDDPLEFAWDNLSTTAAFSVVPGASEVIGFEDGHRIWQQCAEIVTDTSASYDFSVTVWDLGWSDGMEVHIEDLLDAGQTSQDTLTFPIHTGFHEEPMCFDAAGELVHAAGVDIERVEDCSFTTAEDYYCSGDFEIDAAILPYLCDGTDLIEEALYPDCPVVAEDAPFFPFDGTFGTAWETLAPGTTYLMGTQSYHPSDMPLIYNFFDTVGQSYDPLTDTWTDLVSPVPNAGYYNGPAPVGDDLWMIRNSAIYRYETLTDTWSSPATITGGDDLNMTESDEFGVIFGHTSDGNIVEYDTISGSLSYHTTGLGSLYETRMGYDPGTRSIFFGAYPQPDLYRFGIDDLTVTAVTPIPEVALNDIFCSDRAGHIYAAGDFSGTTLFQYDVATDTWSSLPDLPGDHGNNGTCTVSEDGWLYVGAAAVSPDNQWYRLALY